MRRKIEVETGEDDLSRGGQTRTALVDAVIRSVAKHGLEGTTISRVSEISGLSRGLVSFHFDGKDKLLDAALTRAAQIYEASWQELVEDEGLDPAARLHRVVDHDFDFAAAHPELLALWWAAWGETRAKKIYRAASETREARIVDDLVAMFKAAGLGKAASRNAALLLYSTLYGFWLQYHIEERRSGLKDFRAVTHGLVDILLAQVTAG